MRRAAFIPIKTISTRLEGKNFRILGGLPLYQHVINHALQADCFDEVFVDTDSDEIADFAVDSGAVFIERDPHLATDDANGNDLIVRHAEQYPEFDHIFQLFATSPFLQPGTIRQCVEALGVRTEHDSIFTVSRVAGWFWFQGQPVNFRPGILPRSQDANTLTKETCGLYGLRRETILKYRCRIGANPIEWVVGDRECLDIDNIFDLEAAQQAIEGVTHGA